MDDEDPDNPRRIKLAPYPTPKFSSPGFGVAFNWYDNIKDAKACAEAVELNLVRLQKTVYDYPVHRPGYIHKISDLDPIERLRNLYKVCII
jgi:hypothetical protein